MTKPLFTTEAQRTQRMLFLCALCVSGDVEKSSAGGPERAEVNSRGLSRAKPPDAHGSVTNDPERVAVRYVGEDFWDSYRVQPNGRLRTGGCAGRNPRLLTGSPT